MKVLYYLPAVIIYGINAVIFLAICYLPFDEDIDLSIDIGIMILKDGFIRFLIIAIDIFLIYKMYNYFKRQIRNNKRIGTTNIKETKLSKYKTTNFDDPELLKSAGIDIVDEITFLKLETNRIPLFIGTQFGVYPKKYADLEAFHGRKIGFIGKSLLSGVHTEIRDYIVDEHTLNIITNKKSQLNQN